MESLPDAASAAMERGSKAAAAGRWAEAAAAYSEALRLDSKHPSAYRLRGVVQYNLGDRLAAIADYTAAISHDPADAEAWEFRALAKSWLQLHDDALADLSESIRLNPNRAEAFATRGGVQQCRKNYDAAVADYSAAIRLAPSSAEYFRDRGVAFQWLQDHDSALEDYTSAIRLNPGDDRALSLHGEICYHFDDEDSAIRSLTESIRLNPGCARTLTELGRVHADRDESELAIASFTEALRVDPAYADAYRRRAVLRLDREEIDQAISDLDAAIALEPNKPSTYRSRSAAWLGLNDFDRADADFCKAMELESRGDDMTANRTLVYSMLKEHFEPLDLDKLSITERRFPSRIRADLQHAIDRFLESSTLRQFTGVRKQYEHGGVNLTDLLVRDRNDPPMATPPQYLEIDIGEGEPVRCLKSGLWLAEQSGVRFAVLMEPESQYRQVQDVGFHIAVPTGGDGDGITQRFFQNLEQAVREARSYRGKILSLEFEESYRGMSHGIRVHRLQRVEREQVILPPKTLDLLDRNVIQFVRQRGRLAEAGMATKKGLLFYGPPGTGKTHTLHYLASALTGMTTLLITAEQVGLLGEYMTLARMLQPSMVVIEDADLIVRDRQSMHGPCEEALLNKLLNEMDGLKENVDILFILTTNRPEAIEAALASRPGRVDQAIEFPFPDDEGRGKLITLYARSIPVDPSVIAATIRKTDRVSGAFIKELMRRAAQFRFERDGEDGISPADIDNALDELLHQGGSLNRKLLGGQVDSP